MTHPRRLALALGVLGVLAWFLWLPLSDILAYPERLSVLPNLETDAAAYDAFARELASTGAASSLPAKHPPGWMVMLAAVYRVVGHSYVAGKLISWLALVVTVGLCAWLARRVYGVGAAAIAALLCATSPGLRAYVGTLQYEVVTGALFLALLVLTVRASESRRLRQALASATAAGLVAAVLVLTRETFVLVVPLAALWLWTAGGTGGVSGSDPENSGSGPESPEGPERSTHWPNGSARMAAPLLLAAVAATPALLWSAVQTVEHQRLILISDKAREVFDAGNNPRANGTYNEPLVGIGEPAGLDFIRAYPRDALTLAGRKLLYSFGVLRDGWNVPHALSVWIWRATTGVVPLAAIDVVVRGGWLLALFLIALVRLGRDGWRRWWLLPASAGAILAVHVVTLASYRFAVPLLPVFYVLASGPLAAWLRAAQPALRAPLVAVPLAILLTVAIAAQFQRWPLHVRYAAADLDGLAAGNAIDPVSGAPARVADAERGIRPVALLPDTYFPRGRVRVAMRLRRTSPAAQDSVAVARLLLAPLSAPTPCVTAVPAGQMDADRFVEITMQCHLEQDGPATLAVFSLGQVDLAIDSLELTWMS